MKRLSLISVILFLLIGCFEPPTITPPRFVEKSPPDSVQEKGIDAHSDNAIYLEWIEPETAENEVLLGYYLYRGKLIDQEYQFDRIATIERDAGILEESDKYIDYEANIDTTYYYYLRSFNDFTTSKETSDTALYKLAYKATSFSPTGNIYNSRPSFYFTFPSRSNDRINYFYLRLYYLDGTKYKIKLFLRRFRFSFSLSQYTQYLENNDTQTTVLIDSLWTNQENQKYLIKGNYRWRIDAVSGELGGAPETEGSESEWISFTVK